MQRASVLRPFADWLRTHEWQSRADIERDIDDEIAFHLEMRERDLVEAGLSESDARRAAQDRFGDVVRVKDKCRKVKLGERVMLQRLHVVLLAVLLAAVVGIGWQSIAAQTTAHAEIGRMSAEIRQLTSALEASAAVSSTSTHLAGPDATSRKAIVPSAPSRGFNEGATGEFDVVSESARWLERAKKVDTWRGGVAFGQEIAALPPEQSVAILTRIWSRIPNVDCRKQLLKVFVFDGALDNACEVLHLAATDKEIGVQTWAFEYLKSFAWRDFALDAASYAEWRATTAGLPLAQVLETSASNWLLRVRAESGASLQQDLELAAKVDQRTLERHMAKAALDVLRTNLMSELARAATTEEGPVQRSALSLAGRIGIDDAFRQRVVMPLLARGSPAAEDVRVAAVQALVAGDVEGRTALLLEVYERESDAGTSRNAVTGAAVSELHRSIDAHSLPDVIDFLSRHDLPSVRRDIGSVLEALTGVPTSQDHGASFWIEWVAQNRQRLPAGMRDLQVVQTKDR
jgi:hypothetical protein